MSRKFREKILQGSGFSHKKFECDYGLKLLKSMGWKEGNGLGKSQQGSKECVQIKRREENLGLGVNEQNTVQSFKWNDNWWDKAYTNAINKINIINSDESEQSSSSDNESKMIKIQSKKIKKEKKQKKQEEQQQKIQKIEKLDDSEKGFSNKFVKKIKCQ